MYNRIVEPKMLLWLIEASEVDPDVLAQAQRRANCKRVPPNSPASTLAPGGEMEADLFRGTQKIWKNSCGPSRG